jgi:hypothetical protein
MKIKNCLSIFRPGKLKIFLIALIAVFYFLPGTIRAAENPSEVQITVWATIGEPKLTVFGWASPQALIELKGQRVSELAIADETGYFYFDRVFLPPPKPNYPEVCLSVVDRSSRISSFPTCLPPLPPKLGEIRVGPVLLPPTLSLERGEFLPGEQVKATGATFPNSKVKIFLANENLPPNDKKPLSLNPYIPKSLYSYIPKTVKVYAHFLPQYEIQSDEQGNFEFNLPASYPQNWKVYAAAEFQGSPSPKSVSLSFRVLGWWAWIWKKAKEFLLAGLALLKPHWWWLVIISEILLILILWRKKSTKPTALALPPPRKLLPMKQINKN